MLTLVLPGGIEVIDGAILSFGDDPCKYILHYGPYKVTSVTSVCGPVTRITGWYVQQFGSGVAIPISDDMLSICKVHNTGAEITVTGSPSGCRPPHKVCRPSPETFTSQDKYQLDRSWLTVDTVAERDALPKTSVMTGRIVEVNNATQDGEPSYYRWNYKTQEWDNIIFVHSDVATDLEKMQEQLKVLHLIMFGTPDIPDDDGNDNSSDPGVPPESTDPGEGEDRPSVPTIPVEPIPVKSLIRMVQEMYENNKGLVEYMDNLIEDFNTLHEKVSELEKLHFPEEVDKDVIDVELPLRYGKCAEVLTANYANIVEFDDNALLACGVHDKIASFKTMASQMTVTGMCENDSCKVLSAEIVTDRYLKFTVSPSICDDNINHKSNMIIHCKLVKKTSEDLGTENSENVEQVEGV